MINIRSVFVIIFFILSFQVNTFAEKYIMGSTPNTQYWNDVETDMGDEKIVHWTSSTVRWYMDAIGAFPDVNEVDTENALKDSYNSWESISTSTISFIYEGAYNVGWQNDGNNVHKWPPATDDAYKSGEPLSGGLGVYAITILTYNTEYEILDADVLYNQRDYTWRANGRNEPDIQAIATHEVGHVLGLHHTEVTTTPKPTMAAQWLDIDKRTLEFDDLVGVSFLYGGNLIDDENLAGTFKWDLSNVTGKTITIDAGSELIFENSSSLEINGTLNINGLSGNPVSMDFEVIGAINGLKLLTGATADISYVDIKNAKYGVKVDGAATVDIEDCNDP